MPFPSLQRILIADRNMDLADILRNYLGLLGLSNVYLSTTSCALQDLVNNDFFHLAFLDAELVSEWFSQKTSSGPQRFKPGIILTHWDLTARVQDYMGRLLACAFLKKPYDALQIKDMARFL